MYHKQLIGLLIKAWVKRIYNKKPISLRKVHMTEKWCACSAPSVYL